MADWVTTADVKTYCGIETADTGKDAAIAATIPRAQAMIEQRLLKNGQVFGTFSNVEEYITPEPFTVDLFIRKHHFISTLTKVQENEIDLVEDTDYKADLTLGRLRRLNGYWSTDLNAVYVKYSTTNAVPEDVKLALIEFVAVLCNIKTKTFIAAEGIERTVSQGIPSFITDLLDARRIPRCAMG